MVKRKMKFYESLEFINAWDNYHNVSLSFYTSYSISSSLSSKALQEDLALKSEVYLPVALACGKILI